MDVEEVAGQATSTWYPTVGALAEMGSSSPKRPHLRARLEHEFRKHREHDGKRRFPSQLPTPDGHADAVIREWNRRAAAAGFATGCPRLRALLAVALRIAREQHAAA